MTSCLVVDDSRVVRMIARKILEGLNFQVEEAEDGVDALRACQKSMPDASLDIPAESLVDSEAIELARKATTGVRSYRPEDFEGMRKAGRLAAEVLDLLVEEVEPGITTEQLDKICFEYVLDHGAFPACFGYRGFRHTICTSLNHVVCHGIPSDRPWAALVEPAASSSEPGTLEGPCPPAPGTSCFRRSNT